MVNLGTIWWSVQVADAASAANAAAQVQDQMGETAEKAKQANEATNAAGQSMGQMGDEADTTSSSLGRMKGATGLATTAFFFLATQVGTLLRLLGGGGLVGTIKKVVGALGGLRAALSLSAIWGAITGALSTISGLLSGFISWLAAGSAGALATAAAIGALIGILGVAILEVTGVLDAVRNFGSYLGDVLPGVARDALLALISVFAGPLAVIGGFISGFVDGVLQGDLIGGIEMGVDRAMQVLDIFKGAWERILNGIWGSVQGFFGELAGVPGRIRTIFSGLGQAIGSSLRGAFNGIIPSRLNIPSVTIGGGSIAGMDIPSVSIGGGSLNLPQLNTGGFIQEGGLAMLHQGETVVPAEVSQQGDTGGGGGAAGGVTIETVEVSIGDQSLNLRNLTRSDLRTLVDLLGDEFGDEVRDIVAP